MTNETELKYQEWLAGLKVGDTVGVEWFADYGREKQWWKSTVKNITKGGQVVLDDDTRFKGGVRKQRDSLYSTHYTLVEWTSDIEVKLAHRELVNGVSHCLDRSFIDKEKVSALSNEDLMNLLVMLRPLRSQS